MLKTYAQWVPSNIEGTIEYTDCGCVVYIFNGYLVEENSAKYTNIFKGHAREMILGIFIFLFVCFLQD